jgi:hypothetical protein
VLVGSTSKGRKGTSWGRVKSVFDRIKPPGMIGDLYSGRAREVSGLSSGEGLKWQVRDEITKIERDKKAGASEEVVTDAGVVDKRLLVHEGEFAQVLRAGARSGNTLSPTIRSAWDSGGLSSLTKNDTVTATGAHIGLIGHITSDELRAELTATDAANGFANRFLFVCVRRSKTLPFGGDETPDEALEGFALRLDRAAQHARRLGPIGMTDNARAIWRKVYGRLSDGRPGLYGAITGRAEAQCIRVALLYALLDESGSIDAPHLYAALALWDYCDASARFIFGDSLGDKVADDILEALGDAGSEGLSRTDISALFKRHQNAARLDAALSLLSERGLAKKTSVATGGRSTEQWVAL